MAELYDSLDMDPLTMKSYLNISALILVPILMILPKIIASKSLSENIMDSSDILMMQRRLVVNCKLEKYF